MAFGSLGANVHADNGIGPIRPICHRDLQSHAEIPRIIAPQVHHLSTRSADQRREFKELLAPTHAWRRRTYNRHRRKASGGIMPAQSRQSALAKIIPFI